MVGKDELSVTGYRTALTMLLQRLSEDIKIGAQRVGVRSFQRLERAVPASGAAVARANKRALYRCL